jgi:hypothetical protein
MIWDEKTNALITITRQQSSQSERHIPWSHTHGAIKNAMYKTTNYNEAEHRWLRHYILSRHSDTPPEYINVWVETLAIDYITAMTLWRAWVLNDTKYDIYRWYIDREINKRGMNLRHSLLGSHWRHAPEARLRTHGCCSGTQWTEGLIPEQASISV